MCVVEVKIHSDGRRSRREKVHHCHEGKERGTLCDHVERKEIGSTTVSKSTPSSSRPSSSSADIITTAKDGKQRHYHRVGMKEYKRSSLGTSSTHTRPSSGTTTPPTSVSNAASRPSSHRRSTKYSYAMPPDPNLTVGPDGTASYERPPSLEMPADSTERPRPKERAEMHEPSPSYRRHRPAAIIVNDGASMTSSDASLNVPPPAFQTHPSVSRFSEDSANDSPLRASKGDSHARVDSLADDDDLGLRSLQVHSDQQASLERARLDASERYQQERKSRDIEARDARVQRERLAASERRQADRLSRQNQARDRDQAFLERERLAESERRQADRLKRDSDERQQRDRNSAAQAERLAREAAAAQSQAQAEEAQRAHHRQQAAAALERSAEEAEHNRQVAAELAQMARERDAADAYRLAADATKYYQPRSMPTSPQQITYANASPFGTPLSARQTTSSYVASPPISARYPVAIHNSYSETRRDSISERGDAVIARAQAAAAAMQQRLSTSMGGMSLQDATPDVAVDAQISRRSSRRQPREVREYERVRERRYQ